MTELFEKAKNLNEQYTKDFEVENISSADLIELMAQNSDLILIDRFLTIFSKAFSDNYGYFTILSYLFII